MQKNLFEQAIAKAEANAPAPQPWTATVRYDLNVGDTREMYTCKVHDTVGTGKKAEFTTAAKREFYQLYRDGYTDVGFSTNKDAATAEYQPVDNVTVFKNNPDVTLYIVWEKNAEPVKNYTVTFDAIERTVSPASITTENGKISSLPVPSREGYKFLGWFTETGGGEQVTADTAFEKDTTLHAHLEKNRPEKLKISSVTLKASPSKTMYQIGDQLDPTDGKDEVTYDDGSVRILNVTADMLKGDTSKAGKTVVTVSYEGKIFTYSVTVEEKKSAPDKKNDNHADNKEQSDNPKPGNDVKPADAHTGDDHKDSEIPEQKSENKTGETFETKDVKKM